MKAILKKSQAAEPFSFAFVDAAGKTVLKSENYKTKDSALNGIASVKKNCHNDVRYAPKEAKDGRFFFNLKAANGQIIGTSTMFSTQSDRDKALAQLKSEGPEARVEEQ
jgi:uncharacterized protein YegP (UPF0339 family)